MTEEQKQQIETLLRIGCEAMRRGKSLEESQDIGATTLALIAVVKAQSPPVTEPQT